MADKDSDDSNVREQRKKIPLLEWLIAAAGLFLVVGTIGFMLYKGFTSTDQPPRFRTNVEQIEKNDSGYLVKFVVINEGDQTASNVQIEGELKNGGESLETSGVTIDYVPLHSQAKGGLFFVNNPQQFSFKISAKGFSEP